MTRFLHHVVVVLAWLRRPRAQSSCSGGQYDLPGGGCRDCPAGKSAFTAVAALANCEDCVAGRWSDQPGLSSFIYVGDDIVYCQACPAGRWNDVAAAASLDQCNICEAGKFQSNEASTTDCTECEAGRWSNASSANCILCEAGKWSASAGATAESTCTSCPEGRFSGIPGAGDDSVCGACPEGKWRGPDGDPGACTDCEAGRWSSVPGATSNATCTGCKAGLWSDTPGATDNSTCQLCGPGKWSADIAQSTCNECTPGRYSESSGQTSEQTCESCDAGEFSPAAAGSCTECEAGRWAATSEASVCSACRRGKWSSTVGANTTDTCLNCSVGKWSDTLGADSEAQCRTCEAGRHGVQLGAANESQCLPCGAGTFSGGGAGPCGSCAPGTWSSAASAGCTSCEAGKWSSTSNAEAANACSDCPAGKFSEQSGLSTVDNCSDCPPGTWSGELGATTSGICTSCGAGRYGTASGSTALDGCAKCEPGRSSTAEVAASDASCGACPAGTWSGSGQADCTSCPAGKYSDAVGASGSSTCEDCPAGKYSDDVGASGSFTCEDCPQGRYGRRSGLTEEGECSLCAEGRWSPSGSSECVRCEVGRWASATGCEDCEAGKWSSTEDASNNTVCRDCPAGRWSPTSAATAVDTCAACPEGTWSSASGASAAATCTECVAGRYGDIPGAADAAACTACVGGRYGEIAGAANDSMCTACVAGTWSNSEGQVGPDDCLGCSAGKYSETAGASAISTCTNCPAGTYNNEEGLGTASGCIPCAPGRWSSAAAKVCVACTAGKWSDLTGATSDAVCQVCAAGKYSVAQGAENESTCTSCPAGKWSSVVGASADTCVACNPGTWSEVEGESSSDSCFDCAAGRWSGTSGLSNRTDCAECPPGTWSASAGATEDTTCVNCELGKYQDNVGASDPGNCTKCPAGTWSDTLAAGDVARCIACLAGKWSDADGATSEEVCHDCDAGKWSGTPGAPSESTCENCGAGKFSDVTGASTLDTCGSCGRGKWSGAASTECTDCAAGKWSDTFEGGDESTCELCVAGKWSGTVAATEISACTSCVAGRFSEVAGAAASGVCRDCRKGTWSGEASSACVNCTAGKWSDARSATSEATCASCQRGKYSEVPGAPEVSTCQNCPEGTYNEENASSSREACVRCEEGKWSGTPAATSGDTCLLCQEGKYSTTVGASDESTCMNCTAGRYSSDDGASGNETCLPCAGGLWSGEEGAGGSETCQPCGAGRYSSVEGAISNDTCQECVAGRWSSENATQCTNCSVGKFSDEGGASSIDTCDDCKAGTWSDTLGADSNLTCIECAGGKYSNASGASSDSTCTDCAAGKWSIISGAASIDTCKDCPRGTSTFESNRTACRRCATGSFSSHPGAAACGACPANAAITGAVACCPSHNVDDWPDNGALQTSPGKSEVEIFRVPTCGDQHGFPVNIFGLRGDPDNKYVDNQLQLRVQYTNGDIASEQCIQCNADPPDGCRLSVEFDGDDQFFTPSDTISIMAEVKTFTGDDWAADNFEYHSCVNGDVAGIMIEGFGCDEQSLTFFFASLTCAFVASLILGYIAEIAGRLRRGAIINCKLDICIPDKHDPELPTARILRRAIFDNLMAYGRETGTGPPEPEEDATAAGREKRPPPMFPKGTEMNKLLPRSHFLTWTIRTPARSGSLGVDTLLRIEFGIRSLRSEHSAPRELQAKMMQVDWAAPRWEDAKVTPYAPGIERTRARAPGLELVALIEMLLRRMCNRGRDDMSTKRVKMQLHDEIADRILERLMQGDFILVISLVYLTNLAFIVGLPLLAYYSLFEECSDGFPWRIHIAFYSYIFVSSSMSILMILKFGGESSAVFVREKKLELFLRVLVSAALLSDVYQDVTFPVIARTCRFDLWQVATWLIIVGFGMMQVLGNLVMIGSCVYRYRVSARTPEERERLKVEGTFLALRGSDNLVLLYAIRPAVEERLGGASSWAMKTAEARIAFLRFLFEDIEQSALQLIFVINFDQTSATDRIWVFCSVATSSVLSITLVVQTLPEIRDWVWYRVLRTFPLARNSKAVRALWLFIVLLLIRVQAALPWIAACSPQGDTCEAGYQGMWSCVDDRLQLSWVRLPIRQSIVDTVLRSTLICVVSVTATVALVAFLFWSRSFRAKRLRRQAMKDKLYNEGRLKDLLVKKPRPKRDEDFDRWVIPVRQLHAALRSNPESRKFVNKLDLKLYQLARPEFFRTHKQLGEDVVRMVTAIGGSVGIEVKGPRVRCGCCKRPTIKDAARKGFDEAGERVRQSVGWLSEETEHAVKIARIRANVRQHLSSKKFLRAKLHQKAKLINEATDGDAPIRLVHWRVLGEVGELPKFNPDPQKNHAKLMDDVYKTVELENSGATPVLLFLTHRWLRTTGPHESHHPDDLDNSKAKCLVRFADWYIERAKKSNINVEVFFWIDWCCTNQDALKQTEIAIATLPLYIASCTKVVAWNTPDFDRRCWIVVERLLSYTFCQGGLTPYVIDETFRTALARAEKRHATDASTTNRRRTTGWSNMRSWRSPARSSARSGNSSTGVWQVNIQGNQWKDFDAAAQATLRDAKLAGQAEVQLEIAETSYVVNLRSMTQKNCKTRRERPVRVDTAETGDEECPGSGGAASANPNFANRPPATSRASGSAPPTESITTAVSTSLTMGLKPILRSRKLSDPSDPEICQVTRSTDRSHIVQLVDIALSSNATMEVFADRQAVEWGLTEIVEQVLTDQKDLPEQEGRPTAPERPWLELAEGKRTGWRLVVERARMTREEEVRLVDHGDALVWLDPGYASTRPQPDPEEIDGLFKRVHSVVAKRDADKKEGKTEDKEEGKEAGQQEEMDRAIRELIIALKSDLEAAMSTQGEGGATPAEAKTAEMDRLQNAIDRARDVQLVEKEKAASRLCTLRLEEAKQSRDEAEMRRALLMAHRYGGEHLQVYAEVQAMQRQLYLGQLEQRLQEQLAVARTDRSPEMFISVYLTAAQNTAVVHGDYTHVCKEIEGDIANLLAEGRSKRDINLIEAMKQVAEAIAGEYVEAPALVLRADIYMQESALLKAMDESFAGKSIAAMRGVELHAKDMAKKHAAEENMFGKILGEAQEKVRELQKQIGKDMGLPDPEDWDVVLELTGAEIKNIVVKKTVEKDAELRARMQQLVDKTFTGGKGRHTYTRDRKKQDFPVASKLEVKEVIYVQNAQSFVNFSSRRKQIAGELQSRGRTVQDYRVLTGQVPLTGYGRHKALDESINEVYLWHGCSPEAAKGITGSNFDLSRAGTGAGTMFGAGIYLAESCLKADEYTKSDSRGWFPLLLCRAVLGNVNYVDDKNPGGKGPLFMDSCKKGRPFHSVLGDRMKVKQTFREFIVFDEEQTYPECIVWYKRCK